MSTNRGFISCVIRLLFFFSCIGFHVGVFFTMGPNFMRQAGNPFIFEAFSSGGVDHFGMQPSLHLPWRSCSACCLCILRRPSARGASAAQNERAGYNSLQLFLRMYKVFGAFPTLRSFCGVSGFRLLGSRWLVHDAAVVRHGPLAGEPALGKASQSLLPFPGAVHVRQRQRQIELRDEPLATSE